MSTNTRTNARQLRMREQAMQEARKESRRQRALPSRPTLSGPKAEKTAIFHHISNINDKSRNQGAPIISNVHSMASNKVHMKMATEEEEWDTLDPDLLNGMVSNFVASSRKATEAFKSEDRKTLLTVQTKLPHSQNCYPLLEAALADRDSGADGESTTHRTLSSSTDTSLLELKSPVQIPTQRLLLQAASVDSPRSTKICPIKIISNNGTPSNLRISTSYQPWTTSISSSSTGTGMAMASPPIISLAPLRVTTAPSVSRSTMDSSQGNGQMEATVIATSQLAMGSTPIFYLCTSNPPQFTTQLFSQTNQLQQSQVPLKPSTSCPTHIGRHELQTNIIRSPQSSQNECKQETMLPSASSSITSINLPSSSVHKTSRHVSQQSIKDKDDSSVISIPDTCASPAREKQKRVSHNQVEKRRREVINQQISILRDMIPMRYFPTNGSNKQKGNILTATASYINHLRQQEEANKVLRHECNNVEEAVKGLIGRAWLLSGTLREEGVEVPSPKLILECEDRLMEWSTLIQLDSDNQFKHDPVQTNLDKYREFLGCSSDVKTAGFDESHHKPQYVEPIRFYNHGLKMEPLSVGSNNSDSVMEVDERNTGAF